MQSRLVDSATGEDDDLSARANSYLNSATPVPPRITEARPAKRSPLESVSSHLGHLLSPRIHDPAVVTEAPAAGGTTGAPAGTEAPAAGGTTGAPAGTEA